MNDFALSYNQFIVGKSQLENNYMNNFNYRNIPAVEADAEFLMELLGVAGFATTYVLKDEDIGRKGGNVAGGRVFQLDFDNTWSIADAKADVFYQAYGIGIYSSASFGKTQEQPDEKKLKTVPEHQRAVILSRVGLPKQNFRIVFQTESFIQAELITPFLLGMFELFPMADVSCKDTGRMFYGSPNAAICEVNHGVLIDDETVKTLIMQGMKDLHDETHVESHAIARDSTAGELSIKLASGRYTNTTCLFAQLRLNEKKVCYSPFRQEHAPSAVLWKKEKGIFIFDSGTREKQFVFVK